MTRHFLACCAKDGVGRQTLVDADIGGEKFEARGLIIDQRGWLDIYRWERVVRDATTLYSKRARPSPSIKWN